MLAVFIALFDNNDDMSFGTISVFKVTTCFFPMTTGVSTFFVINIVFHAITKNVCFFCRLNFLCKHLSMILQYLMLHCQV